MRTKYEDRELKGNNSSDNLLEGIGEYWGEFYRANPHRCALDYFEFPLHIFQQVLIYFMFKSDQFLMSCTRGLGKTWLISVFCVLVCTLRPGIKIVVAAKRKKQAQKIITDKIIGELYKDSIALQKEIKEYQINSKEVSITFWNGSKIEAIVSNQDARGYD